MIVQNISGRKLSISIGSVSADLISNQTTSAGTFPDTEQAAADAEKYRKLGYIKVLSSTLEAEGDLDVPAGYLLSATGLPVVLKAATGTLTITSTGPAADETFAIDGTTFTFKVSASSATEVTISTTPATQAANIVSKVNAQMTTVTAANVLGVVTFTAVTRGTAGNSIALAESAANVAKSATTLLGGTAHGAEPVTINDVVFEACAQVGDVSDSSYVPVLIGATASTWLTNLQTAVNANTTLQGLQVQAQSLITIVAATDVRLTIQGNGSTAASVTEDVTNLAIASVAAVNRTAGVPVMEDFAVTGTTALVNTGLRTINRLVVQAKTSANALKPLDGTLTIGDGLFYITGGSAGILANGDTLTYIAEGV